MTESSSGPSHPQPDPVVFKITAGTLTRALQFVRRMLGWITFAYVGGLILTLAALEWWGERFWLFGVLLYAPAQMLLLPLLALTPVCLVFRRRLVLWHLGAVGVLVFGYMNFRWSSVPKASDSTITAITFNAGESSRPQFLAFLQAEKPDLILLQDARGRSAELVAKIPGMTASELGQFSLLSKFPVQKANLVSDVKWHDGPIAARYEVEIKGRVVAIYSVHLPTPRQELSRFLGGRRVLGDLVGRRHREPGFGNYREWLEERIRLARDLAAIFAAEKFPMIVGGDFNTPDHGYIYHLFASEMTDGFSHAGRGWGLTFPGSTHNPISFFGPWLRIDYFFTGRGWRIAECRPEEGRKSQHKAVLARFETTSEN
jgi:endonuclease/exonuclease/phosphatase (EEP) superfamily protein YafD